MVDMIRFIVWPGVPKIAGIACVSVLFFERSICCKMTGAAACAIEMKLVRRVTIATTLLRGIAMVRTLALGWCKGVIEVLQS